MNSAFPKDLQGFEIDHIGIAVPSLKEGMEFYKKLGFTNISEEEVPQQKTRVGMLELKNNARIELLESMTQDGPIAKFLEKRGPGIHHICLRVQNIETLLLSLKNQGVRLIDEKAKPGAHNCMVAFVHPASTGGVLLELSQPGEKHD
jgi:methylmalonyl-CoA/ethylmalonyl-CoA epimerase